MATEPIARLKERALRRFEATFVEPPPAEALRVPGVRELGRHGATVTLEVAGSVDRLLKVLAGHTVLDLRTEQPSLDEILLAYYQTEAAA